MKKSLTISISVVSGLAVLTGLVVVIWLLRTRPIDQPAPRREPSAGPSVSEPIAQTVDVVQQEDPQGIKETPRDETDPIVVQMRAIYEELERQKRVTPDREEAPSPGASPSADSDQDGLSDEEEGRRGTDPQKADTDGDGLTDGQEVNAYKTDPKVTDSDNDGYPDADEIKNGYNPLGADRCPTPGCLL